MGTRDPIVLGRHIEGLQELQDLRHELDVDGPIVERLPGVLAAAIDCFSMAQTLRALLLTDPELQRQFQAMSARTGLGPHIVIEEVAEWLRRRRDRGELSQDLDVRPAATVICAAADFVATLDHTVAAPVADASFGGRERLLATLFDALGVDVHLAVLAE